MMVRRLAVYRAGDGKPFTQAEEFDPADVKALRKELLTKVGYIRDGKPSPEKFEAASAEFQRLCKLWRARAEELRAKK